MVYASSHFPNILGQELGSDDVQLTARAATNEWRTTHKEYWNVKVAPQDRTRWTKFWDAKAT